MEINKYAPDGISKILIGNKNDRSDRLVSNDEGQSLANELNIPFMETSALTSDNVNLAFIKLSEHLIQKRILKLDEENLAILKLENFENKTTKSSCCYKFKIN